MKSSIWFSEIQNDSIASPTIKWDDLVDDNAHQEMLGKTSS